MALAARVLRGDAPLPQRAATDAYFAQDDDLRRAQHEVYREDLPVGWPPAPSR